MKRYLLDTHLIYWWMTADKQLGNATQNLIAESEILVSTVSIWEMVLKNAKGKLPLPQGKITEQIQSQGFTLLPILPRHIEATRNLICSHPDPFDRLLIAQARDEQLILLTRDSAILALGFSGVEKG
jgi:PIN domain nuclease of toxin-antitoxin system